MIHTKGGAEGTTRWLENGYADDPREAASIPRDAAEVGIVGGSIKDWSERIYEFNHAVERVAAGAEMARSQPVPFTFVARAENLAPNKELSANPNNNHRSAAHRRTHAARLPGTRGRGHLNQARREPWY